MSNGTEQIFLPDSVSTLLHDMEMSVRRGNGEPTINTINLENVSDFSKVCRVCAAVTELVMPIFSGEGLRINLADKIKRHLPIKVTSNDVLPVVVCFQCTSTLLATHELVACSLQADAALRTAQARRERPALPPRVIVDAVGNVVEDQPGGDVSFKAVVKKVLLNYFHTLNMDEGEDCQFACQQCSWRGHSTDLLVEHLHTHRVKPPAVDGFIRRYITFEQPLESEDDTTPNAPVKPGPVRSPPKVPSHCCPFCDSIFSSTARLGHHFAEHVEIREDSAVECCGALYSDRSLFIRHALDRHDRAPLPGIVCRACGHAADSPATLADHIKNAHADDAITRRRRTDARRNPKSKDQKYIPAPCPDCGKKFSNKYNMAVHLKSHHTKSEKVRCELCNRSYSNRNSLVSHMKLAHGGLLRFACDVCGERFQNRSVRAVHVAIHTGERPHVCTVEDCSGSFRSRNSLLRHLDAHKNLRSYTCHCGKAFQRRWHLKRHLKTHQMSRQDSTMEKDETTEPT